ncbi:MAG: helix-turn-helix transcriptional regulator [Deltaproteobacteria bacterium]|nr:helix-turn-helix transcriptional regulator [Deltaproteobacteria bacterium]
MDENQLMSLQIEIGIKLGNRIKELRKKNNLTQESLAERSNVSVKHIQRLESKTPCGVRLVTLYQLAQALDISLSKLVNFK